MRRNYLGDRGENETDIQESENDLTGETNQEENTSEDIPPPLEDIDQSEDEEEENETEQEDKIVEIPSKPKEDDIGKSSSKELFFLYHQISCILFIRHSVYPSTITKCCDAFVI